MIFAGRVEHQVHLAAHPLAHGMDIGDLLANRGAAPAVNLEGGIAQFQTLLGKIGKGFGRGKPIGLVVAVIGAGVAGNAAFVAAQQFVDGRVVELASNVPQRNVDGGHADARHLAQGAVDFAVDLLACQRAAPLEKVPKAAAAWNIRPHRRPHIHR